LVYGFTGTNQASQVTQTHLALDWMDQVFSSTISLTGASFMVLLSPENPLQFGLEAHMNLALL